MPSIVCYDIWHFLLCVSSCAAKIERLVDAQSARYLSVFCIKEIRMAQVRNYKEAGFASLFEEHSEIFLQIKQVSVSEHLC